MRQTARLENGRSGLLKVMRAHTKAPYKTDLLWEMLRALNRPRRARTEVKEDQRQQRHAEEPQRALRAVLTSAAELRLTRLSIQPPYNNKDGVFYGTV